MAKEKKRKVDEVEKKETLFYYEIIGVILIVFSTTVLGKFGRIGSFFTLLFKTCFGDWYWLFILFILFLGIYNLFLHKKFDFKSNVFIGFCFISLSILLMSHFPLHNYAAKETNNYFSKVWSIYKTYLNEKTADYLGGGVIGAFLFYLIFYLFGKYGVILCAILIFMLGFSLFINKPIIDIFAFFTSKAKYVKKYTGNFANFFKYELGSDKRSPHKNKESIFLRNISLPIRLFDANKADASYVMQDKISGENKNLILSILNTFGVEYKFIDMKVSYKVTTYKILLYTYVDIKMLVKRLQEVIVENFFYSKINNVLTIQITNQYEQILTMNEILLKQNSLLNNYIVPIGISNCDFLIEVDIAKKPNFLIVGSENSGIKTFISAIISILFSKVLVCNYELEIFDIYNDFEKYNDIIDIKHGSILEFLDLLIDDVNSRLDTFKKFEIFSFTEYNRKIEMGLLNETYMKRKIIIINHINMDKETFSFFENKIMYINQSAIKAGINVFLICRNSSIINNVVLSVFENKMFFKCEKEKFDNNIIKNDNSYYLLGNGDAILESDNETTRLQTPLITSKEIEKVIKFLLN